MLNLLFRIGRFDSKLNLSYDFIFFEIKQRFAFYCAYAGNLNLIMRRTSVFVFYYSSQFFIQVALVYVRIQLYQHGFQSIGCHQHTK